MSLYSKILVLALLGVLAGCGKQKDDSSASIQAVKTIATTSSEQPLLALSGTIRAQIETPLAFQINGRIAQRLINAGQTVQKGQVLFELDRRDLNQFAQAAAAEVAAAQSAFNIAQSDSQRNRQLLNEKFISRQGYDRVLLQEREAKTRLDAALSRQQQAINAQDYGQLTSPVDGIVTEVTGETGQVVAAGQAIGTLAHSGQIEVEVFLPEGTVAPKEGMVQYGQQQARASLREVAGSADPVSRTLRARYQLDAAGQDWPLGVVAKVNLNTQALANQSTPSAQHILIVPIGALDERGQGPQVWHIVDGKAQPEAVKIVNLNTETATIQTSLNPGERVIAMGTHLLNAGMPVREIAP